MDEDRRPVVVGGSAGLGAALSARLAASVNARAEHLLMGYPSETRVISITDTPEIVVEGHYFASIGAGSYRLTPVEGSPKHWPAFRTMMHDVCKIVRKREQQAARRIARRAMRKARK